MSTFRVLHLSDLHIGNTFLPPEELACKIADDIAQNGLKGVRCVLVTGDIFNGPSGYSESLVKTAAAFFHKLMEQINLDQGEAPLSLHDFVFVPGNHDIFWSDDQTERWQKYRDFLTLFYGSVPSYYDSEDFSVVREYQEEQIAFLGFNSCGLEKNIPHNAAYGSCAAIPEEDYKKAGIDKKALLALLSRGDKPKYDDFGEIPSAQIASMRRRTSHLSDYTLVALFHHHFYLFPDIAKNVGDADVVRNHAALVRGLRTMGVKTVLHGHKHFDLERPFINEDYYDSADSIIDVFAGGSAGAGGLQQHTFSIIDFFPERDPIKLIQKKFVYREDHLEPLKVKQIPPVNTMPRLIRLLELLKEKNYDFNQIFTDASMASQRLYTVCTCIIQWLDAALTGFSEVGRYLLDDSLCLPFLLFSVYLRALKSLKRHEPEGAGKYDGASEEFDALYKKYLEPHVPDGYLRLFDFPRLMDAASFCDKLLDESMERCVKQYLAFSMVGIFFADLYLVLTEYADDFYGQISHKVNIRLEPNQFHQHVPAARITLSSDSDRRSAYVNLWCREATAHKLAVLFVKEFDLVINKFEDYFKLIGLKLYYLLPKIEKDPSLDALDNYNFEAYIPTLLPLLTGDNIYDSKEVFARELIQNSIDAISVRLAMDRTFAKKDCTIRIQFGQTEQKKPFFQITDQGTGMDRYKIERYFTSIGRSFYSGDDYAELGISYKPISSFGIGFLSSFMVCQEIDVQTRSFQDEKEGLRLHIPNYEGCFFIERDLSARTGTNIRLYLNDSTNEKKITDYINRVMVDIQYPIHIERSGTKRNLVLPAHKIRADFCKSPFRFFVPFHEDGTAGELDWKKEILSGRTLEQYPYGVFIFLPAKDSAPKCSILNSGILMETDDWEDLFHLTPSRLLSYGEKIEQDFRYFHLVFNFPSNWIQMDVSREEIVGFSPWMEQQHHNQAGKYIWEQITQSLGKQADRFLAYAGSHSVNIPALYAKSLFRFLSKASVKAPHRVPDPDKNYFYEAVLGRDKISFTLKRGPGKNTCDADDFPTKWKMLFLAFHFKDTKLPFSGLVPPPSALLSDMEHLKVSSYDFLVPAAKDFVENYPALFCALFIMELFTTRPDRKTAAWHLSSVQRRMESFLLQRFTISDAETGKAVFSMEYQKILEYLKSLPTNQ